MNTPLSVLNQVFGYPAFRGRQEEVIDHLVGGGDALVLMPTGGGKSLCYQIPALLRPGVGVVVSPLIALMHDQVVALEELGVRAAYLNSSLTQAEATAVERSLLTGGLDLVYVAPERLLTPRFLAQLDRLAADGALALFAIDEAHCVSQWGHDFRPEYIGLSALHERFPQVPRIALTATADQATREEIVARLALQQARCFVDSFDRPNIRYRIVDKEDPRRQLLAFLRAEHPGEAGIVYCLSRRKVDDTAQWLVGQGVAALPYHAGMDTATRRRHQERFLREDGVVMVATIAFGMGIDKPDVRFVAHLDLPKSMEGYYQETGRAGRDGLPADAWMAYGLSDVVQQRRMIEESPADAAFKRLAHGKLDALLALCETTGCRRQRLLAYFGEQSTPCGNCDTCLVPPEPWDATEAARKALSCIYRSGQRFGALHVIDILLGRDTEAIRRWGHEKLSTWGIGSELDQRAWRGVFRQLVALGLVEVNHAGHNELLLTAAARPVLKGEQHLTLSRRLREAPAPKAARTTRAAPLPLDPAATERFERLRAWRLETARQHDVPAYIIFPDITLAEIARRAPQELAALRAIPGIGEKKLASYGAALVELCGGETPSVDDPVPEQETQISAPTPAESSDYPGLSDTAGISLRLLNQGLDVAAIALQRNLKETTIRVHLAEAVALGLLAVEEATDLPSEELASLARALDEAREDGAPRLKPVFERFEGRYDYGTLRCIAATLPAAEEDKRQSSESS